VSLEIDRNVAVTRNGRNAVLNGRENDVVERLGLRVVYEDPEVLVTSAPNEDELRRIIIEMLRESPKSIKEMHAVLAGIASEDKIRRAVVRLYEEGYVVIDDEGKVKLIGVSTELDENLI